MDSWKFLKFWKGRAYADLWYGTQNALPPVRDRFKAFELTPFEKVKCVILGQDPYPTPGHAMGLAFSVYPHIRPIPPSLRNIFREYVDDLGYPFPRTGDLTPWAKEGVLLLNTIFTVEAGKSNSHAGIGWEKLTYEVISALGNSGRVVFCLWGKNAQEYQSACKDSPVVALAHPSPLSASKGFFGSKPFSRVNEYLGKERAITWRLP